MENCTHCLLPIDTDHEERGVICSERWQVLAARGEVLCPPDDEASLSSTLSLGPAFNTRSTTPPVSASLSLLCPLCSFSTSSIISLGQHLRSQHKDDYLLESQLAGFGLVRCPSCAKPFHTLKGHIEHCPSTFCIATSVTEDDAKSDPPSLPTVSDPLLLVGSFVPRLWRSLPIFLWKSWTDLCRPFFRNYISASVSFTDNPQLLGDALRSILSLPRRHLLRVRTRSSTSAYEILKRRLFDVSAGIDLTQGVRKSDTRSPEQRKFERIETLVREGHTGKAAAELTRVESRALSQDTVDKLKKLHPLGPDVLPLLPPDSPILAQVDADILRSIRKMANGAAPGVSGWTADLLLPLVDDEECLNGLACLCGDIINGHFSGSDRHRLIGSVLVAIPKSAGGIRPIAMGECFYKAACIYMLRLLRKEMRDRLGTQFALASGGSEVAVQTMQALMSLHPKWSLMTVDVQNAFNSRKRDEILKILYASPQLSKIFRLVDWAYGKPSCLWIKDGGVIIDSFLSTQGVKQGDPLASFLFALSIAGILNLTTSESATIIAVHDDIFLLGPPQDILTSFDILSRRLLKAGLKIQHSKSSVLTTTPFFDLFAKHNFDISNSFVVGLGTCIARDRPVIKRWLASKAHPAYKPLFDSLSKCKLSSQSAYQILRKCALPSMNYWSRVIPPSAFAEQGKAFDDLVILSARSIFKLGSLSALASKQLVLPVRLGGLGLASVSDVSPIAWSCSLGQAAQYLNKVIPDFDGQECWLRFELDDALKMVNKLKFKFKFPLNSEQFWPLFVASPASRGLQKRVMSQVWEKLRQSLLLKLKPKSGDYVRIVGLKDKFAGVWLNGKFTHPFFRLHDPHMCMAIRLRLGLEPAEGLVFCRCGAPLKTDPLHFLSCKKLSAERTFRHARLTTLISKFANIANIPVRLEPRVGCVRNRADAVVAFASCETLVYLSSACFGPINLS